MTGISPADVHYGIFLKVLAVLRIFLALLNNIKLILKHIEIYHKSLFLVKALSKFLLMKVSS